MGEAQAGERFGYQVSALGFLVQVFRCRFRSRAPNLNLNLLTRSRLLTPETRDMKLCTPANHPDSVSPMLFYLIR